VSENRRDNDKTETYIAIANGTMISQYKVIERIGAGGMGEVYLAEDSELKRQVALKFLPVHLCSETDCRARFKREAQATAKLNHPNIVTIYEVGEYNSRPFIAMEYCRGETLRSMLNQLEVSTEKAIELVIEICEGLNKAHRDGVIHRDIKPANIVIDENGHARLLDFGLAAVHGEEPITKTGSTKGTIGYMSPEQIRGEAADNRSDLFSLGVVFYRILTGRTPFKADNEASTLNAILNEKPPPISKYKTDIPEQLQKIVFRLLEKDPDNRYQSAAAVVSDLKKVNDISELISSHKPPVDWWNRYIVTTAVGILLIFAVYWLYNNYIIKEVSETEPQRKMLAVLPFENLGAPEDEYFTDGMTDEIIARLSGLSGLRVCSRTSAFHYKDSNKPLKAIAEELGADYILEGTIRWDKTGDTSFVRITPQLIRASDDSHIWASTIERALTQVFTVQADIAEHVAEALDIKLLGDEKYNLRKAPTDNTEAYDYYLRGRELFHRFRDRQDYDRAIVMYEKAVTLDSAFVEAYADISVTHATIYWYGYDRSSKRSDEARLAAEMAMAIDPNNISTHIAFGYCYYYFDRDLNRALVEFETAYKSNPNSADLSAAIGYIKRRQGAWDVSYEYQKQALKLDPLSSIIRSNLEETAQFMRRYDAAMSIGEKGLELFPDILLYYIIVGEAIIARDGDVNRALQLLNSAPLSDSRNKDNILYMRWWYYMLMRKYEDALEPIRDCIKYCQTAEDTADYLINLADTYYLLGQKSQSRAYYDSACSFIEEFDKRRLVVTGFIPPSLGLVYSRLGDKEKAIEAARRDSVRLSLSEDAYLGTEPLIDLAITYARVGEYDKAICLIDTLLSIPSPVTVAKLRLDPRYDPLRDNPRFIELLKKYE